MGLRWWVQLVTLAASCYNVGTIWLTQVNWRLWAYVGRDEFPAYHRAWWFGWRGIQPVVFPLGILATLGSFAQLRWRPARVPAWTAWLGVALWVAAWGSTAAWWGRFQGRLDQVRQEDGTLDPLYRRLVATHWARVALVTATALLQVGMTAAGVRAAITPVPDQGLPTAAPERTDGRGVTASTRPHGALDKGTVES